MKSYHHIKYQSYRTTSSHLLVRFHQQHTHFNKIRRSLICNILLGGYPYSLLFLVLPISAISFHRAHCVRMLVIFFPFSFTIFTSLWVFSLFLMFFFCVPFATLTQQNYIYNSFIQRGTKTKLLTAMQH